MRKLLKVMALGAIATTATLSLTSCGGGDDAKTIVFYNTMGENLQTTLKTAIETFEAKYPGWKVESTQVGGYDEVRDAIIGDLQAGTQPDLAYCYADHVAQYITTGTVVDMNKYINSKDTIDTEIDGETVKVNVGYSAEEIADFVPGYYNEGLATNYANYAAYGYEANAMFTLPYVKSTEVLYYNIDALKGINYVDADGNVKVPQTWDELWDVCEQLLVKYPNCTPLGYDSEANWFITMCEQNGWGYTNASDPHFTFNNENTKAWLEDLNDKYEAGLFTTQEIYGTYTSNLFTKWEDENGKQVGSALCIGSSGGASHQSSDDFEWGVAPIPGVKQADGSINNKAISQGPNLVMFETEGEGASEKELMTWMFVKEILEPTFLCSFSMSSGYNPPRQSAFDIPAYETFLEDDENIIAVTAGVAKTMNERFFTSPAFVGSSTARDQVGVALVYAVTGQKTAAKALSDAADKCGA